MERRKLRQIIANQLETKLIDAAHVANIKAQVLAEGASEEDLKEFTRQLEFVLQPLVKKLRRAQGHGKQTGNILSNEDANVMIGSPTSMPDLTEVEEPETAAA